MDAGGRDRRQKLAPQRALVPNDVLVNLRVAAEHQRGKNMPKYAQLLRVIGEMHLKVGDVAHARGYLEEAAFNDPRVGTKVLLRRIAREEELAAREESHTERHTLLNEGAVHALYAHLPRRREPPDADLVDHAVALRLAGVPEHCWTVGPPRTPGGQTKRAHHGELR